MDKGQEVEPAGRSGFVFSNDQKRAAFRDPRDALCSVVKDTAPVGVLMIYIIDGRGCQEVLCGCAAVLGVGCWVLGVGELGLGLVVGLVLESLPSRC
jgi:hypothetical protein